MRAKKPDYPSLFPKEPKSDDGTLPLIIVLVFLVLVAIAAVNWYLT